MSGNRVRPPKVLKSKAVVTTHQPSTAADAFRQWLGAEIAPALRARGWSRSGSSFARRAGSNTAFVQFRRMPRSDTGVHEFTIRLATYSPRIAAVRQALLDLPIPARANPDNAIFDQPIGWLLGLNTEKLWAIGLGDDARRLAELGNEVRSALFDVGIPALKSWSTDESLRDRLLENKVLENEIGLAYLRRLVEDLGPASELNAIDELATTARARADKRRGESLREMGWSAGHGTAAWLHDRDL